MEITDKDFELADNYLDGTLSQEELALFRIRMQDEEFAGLVNFQKGLRQTLGDIANAQMAAGSLSPQQQRQFNKQKVSESLYSAIWFIVVAGICLTSLLLTLIV